MSTNGNAVGLGKAHTAHSTYQQGNDTPSNELAQSGVRSDTASPLIGASEASAVPVHAVVRDLVAVPDAVVLTRADSVKPEAIRWLWQEWLACGKFHVLAGSPGTGKTTIALAVAATISAGLHFPDGNQAMPGNIIVWSGEDGLADTLLPRLHAMGADTSRIHFVDGVVVDGRPCVFDPAKDMAMLAQRVHDIGDVRLLIVDPVVSAVAADTHKNGETRRALQPLVDLAASLDCAVIGISHYSKGTQGRDPIERVTGSIAFAALARLVWCTAKGAEEGQRRRLVRAKSNIGPDGGGFEYDLEQVEITGHPGVIASRIVWCDAIEGSARELLAEAEAVEAEPTQLSDTCQWLRELLADEGGALDKRSIMKLAGENGFADRTVQRARAKLRITVTQAGFGREKKSTWSLPGGADSSICANHANECQSGIPGTYGTNGQMDDSGDDDVAR